MTYTFRECDLRSDPTLRVEYGTDYYEEKVDDLLDIIFGADADTCDYCGNYDTLFAVQGDPLDGESWACTSCRSELRSQMLRLP